MALQNKTRATLFKPSVAKQNQGSSIFNMRDLLGSGQKYNGTLNLSMHFLSAWTGLPLNFVIGMLSKHTVTTSTGKQKTIVSDPIEMDSQLHSDSIDVSRSSGSGTLEILLQQPSGSLSKIHAIGFDLRDILEGRGDDKLPRWPSSGVETLEKDLLGSLGKIQPRISSHSDRGSSTGPLLQTVLASSGGSTDPPKHNLIQVFGVPLNESLALRKLLANCDTFTNAMPGKSYFVGIVSARPLHSIMFSAGLSASSNPDSDVYKSTKIAAGLHNFVFGFVENRRNETFRAWIAFAVIMGAAVVVDFRFGTTKIDSSHSASQVFKRASIFTLCWIFMAIIFAFGVYSFFGAEHALLFMSGYLLEKSLSMDKCV